jgi:Flp pilus assembly protein TadG
MTRLVRSLARDERGATLIEMAMVAPVFASLLIGMVDISRAYSAKLRLEQAAYRAIEKVQQYQTTTSTYSTLQSEAVSAAVESGFTSVTASDVAIDYWLDCNGVRQTSYNTSCSGSDTQVRWITVDITAKFRPMFGSRFFPRANTDGTYTLHGKAGLRTQ